MLLLFWLLLVVALTAGIGWILVPIDEAFVRRALDETEIPHP